MIIKLRIKDFEENLYITIIVTLPNVLEDAMIKLIIPK